MKKAIKWALWAASCVGIWTVFGDGWWKLIGILSVCWMAAATIATFITEGREE